MPHVGVAGYKNKFDYNVHKLLISYRIMAFLKWMPNFPKLSMKICFQMTALFGAVLLSGSSATRGSCFAVCNMPHTAHRAVSVTYIQDVYEFCGNWVILLSVLFSYWGEGFLSTTLGNKSLGAKKKIRSSWKNNMKRCESTTPYFSQFCARFC